MPNLSTSTVTSWLQEQEPTVAVRWKGAVRPVEDDAAVQNRLIELGEVLDRYLNHDAQSLSETLREEPVLGSLRQILAQLGPARLLRVLHWLSFTGLPEGGQVLGGLMRDEATGAGQALRAFVQELHREELLARIFSRQRLQVLLAACQDQQRGAT